MITVHHTKPSGAVYLLLMLLVFLLFGKMGLQAVEWILMKLYEFFIQKNPMSLV